MSAELQNYKPMPDYVNINILEHFVLVQEQLCLEVNTHKSLQSSSLAKDPFPFFLCFGVCVCVAWLLFVCFVVAVVFVLY